MNYKRKKVFGELSQKIILLLILLLFAFVLAGCGSEVEEDNALPRTIEIRDNMFMTQINDIITNLRLYEGRTIILEGFLLVAETEGETMYAVVRNTPGCCGPDGLSGFVIEYERRNA